MLQNSHTVTLSFLSRIWKLLLLDSLFNIEGSSALFMSAVPSMDANFLRHLELIFLI